MPIARPQPMWNIFESVFFSIMLISVIGLCAGFRYNLSHDSTGLDSVIIPLFGYALLLLFLLAWFSSSFQVVYVFGDIFRNGLYPGNTRQISEFVEKQRKLRWLGKCRNIIILGN